MRKTLLVLLAIALAGFASQVSAKTNTGSDAIGTFEGNHISPDAGGPRVLYCPSNPDDAAFRSQVATAVGGTCDYFDARYSTPSVSTLAGYDCVMTWVNYAYLDNNAMGNNLADYVDGGGHVFLGQWCLPTAGNFLAGRIMTSAYNPASGGFANYTTSLWNGDDRECCVHVGVSSYGSSYRDVISLNSGAIGCGHWQDGGQITAHYAAATVFYGSGILGTYGSGQIGTVVGNACICGGTTATQPSTWGAVKDLYH